MPSPFGDPDYWRKRAEDARTQAEDSHDPSARRWLLDIAATYDQLAEQAEAYLRGRNGGSSKPGQTADGGSWR